MTQPGNQTITEPGPDPASGVTETPVQETPIDQGQSGGTHYHTLEEADAAARRWQGETDKRDAELRKWESLKGLGSPDQIRQFMDQILPITQRSDFAAYVKGETSHSGDDFGGTDDDFLSDEEKRLRASNARLEERMGTVNRSIADLRFTQAEVEAREFFGPEIWEIKRGETLQRIRDMSSTGLLNNPESINGPLLTQAFLTSFTDLGELKAVLQKTVGAWAQGRVEGDGALGTTVPSTERAGSAPVTEEPKNFQDAWNLGKRDHEAKVRSGRV
jgi:hypothetical protein